MAKFCEHCGGNVSDNSKFCPHCGAAIVLTALPPATAFGSESERSHIQYPAETSAAQSSSSLRAPFDPARAPAATPALVSSGQPTIAMLSYAGFWIRAVAYVIDTITLYFAGAIVGAVLGNSGNAIALGVLLNLTYFLYFWTAGGGQTLGMRALKLRVQRSGGGSLGFAHALGRYLWLGVAILPLGLGVFWVAWDAKKQGWHDKMADTVVIRMS